MSSSSSSGGGYEPINNISSGWKYVGMVRLGNNADGGAWELSVGADVNTNHSTGDRVWDSNIANGIDSDWVTVSLRVSSNDSGSTGVLTVAATSINHSQGAFSSITNVQIQASALSVQGRLQMQSISAVFSAADGSTETVVVPESSAPDANSSTGLSTVAQAIKITPFSAGFDTVVVTAQVRLTSPNTTLPAADSLSSGIYVFTA